jgi:hypothetical protein
MPVVEDPGRPSGRLLLDEEGEAVGRFTLGERESRPLADHFEPVDGVLAGRAAEIVMRELKGWRVAGEAPFGRLLVALGARPQRHSHVMSRDLLRDPVSLAWIEPPRPDGVRLTPVDRPAIDLAPACLAAYPGDHPDHASMPTPDRPELELEELISGRLMGPLLRCSGLAVGEDGAVLGNGTPGEPPFGGPWISQVFRHPDAPGVGGALLRRALALALRDRLPAVGLAVTHTNPALALYAALGFVDVLESLSVEV